MQHRKSASNGTDKPRPPLGNDVLSTSSSSKRPSSRMRTRLVPFSNPIERRPTSVLC